MTSAEYWDARQRSIIKRSDLKSLHAEAQVQIAADWFFENWTNNVLPYHHPEGRPDTIEIGLNDNPIQSEFEGVLDPTAIVEACDRVERYGTDWGPQSKFRELFSALDALASKLKKLEEVQGLLGDNNPPGELSSSILARPDMVKTSNLIMKFREVTASPRNQQVELKNELDSQLRQNLIQAKAWLSKHLDNAAGKAVELGVLGIAGGLLYELTELYKNIIALLQSLF